MQGSLVQAPFTQPYWQVESVGTYVQPPPEHVPVGEKLRSVAAVTHARAGGLMQLTPAHGSLLQAPFAQPYWQLTSVAVYVHDPPEQLPAVA